MKTKKEIFEEIEKLIYQQGLEVALKDDTRPWGGFFVIAKESVERFAKLYFNIIVDPNQKISPKFLIVQPHTRLSWQYHHRRAELWKLIDGEAGLVKSMTDEENALEAMKAGETIKLDRGERHRLVGRNNWGVVAEIWIHTDNSHPSDEEDIVRLQDDFGRK